MQNSRSQTIHAPRIFPLHLEIPLHLLIARFHVRQPNTERITTRVQAGAGATRQPKAHLTRSANHLQIYFSFVERPCTPYFISVAYITSLVTHDPGRVVRERATRREEEEEEDKEEGVSGGHRSPKSSILAERCPRCGRSVGRGCVFFRFAAAEMESASKGEQADPPAPSK